MNRLLCLLMAAVAGCGGTSATAGASGGSGGRASSGVSGGGTGGGGISGDGAGGGGTSGGGAVGQPSAGNGGTGGPPQCGSGTQLPSDPGCPNLVNFLSGGTRSYSNASCQEGLHCEFRFPNPVFPCQTSTAFCDCCGWGISCALGCPKLAADADPQCNEQLLDDAACKVEGLSCDVSGGVNPGVHTCCSGVWKLGTECPPCVVTPQPPNDPACPQQIKPVEPGGTVVPLACKNDLRCQYRVSGPQVNECYRPYGWFHCCGWGFTSDSFCPTLRQDSDPRCALPLAVGEPCSDQGLYCETNHPNPARPGDRAVCCDGTWRDDVLTCP